MTSAGRSRATALLAAFLPGALTGTQVAGLLFFLNPHLPFDLVPVLRGVAFFGLLLGAASALVLLPFYWPRPERARRWLPWSLTLVLTAAAICTWAHASYFALFLPAGINRRLLKAAILLSLAAVVCFYTALIHHVRQRPYGRRSRLLISLLAIASIYVMMERREAFKPRLGPGPRATTYAGSPRPQLLVVGLETATLDAILPLAEQGRLPFFSRMLAKGSHARLTALEPVRRLPSWTTLASGKLPFQHGVVSESAFAARFLGNRHVLSLVPAGIGFEYWGTWNERRRVDSGMRQVRAVWEIVGRLGLSTGLVGWPLSAPPPGQTRSRGVEIGLSERFFEGDESAAWPAEIAQRARLFRTRWSELAAEQVSRFGPAPPSVVVNAFLGDLWREDLSFFLLEQDPPIDAFFVVLPGLREISAQYFGGYSAVQFEGERDAQTAKAAQLVAAYYEHLDDFLAKLWGHGRDSRLLAVVSAHGIEEAYGWRKVGFALRRQPPLPGYVERGPDGVLLLLGEGVRPGSRMGSAELVDLVPTLLYGLGFPIARDLDGAVLTNAFETAFRDRQPLTFLPSYETFAAPE
jgi:hypothetical protein